MKYVRYLLLLAGYFLLAEDLNAGHIVPYLEDQVRTGPGMLLYDLARAGEADTHNYLSYLREHGLQIKSMQDLMHFPVCHRKLGEAASSSLCDEDGTPIVSLRTGEVLSSPASPH